MFYCLLTLLLAFNITGCIETITESNNDNLEYNASMEIMDLHRNLRFEPPEIDFGSWSVGIARSHKVTLVNENANRSVYLSSVSGRSSTFYSSFFESRVVPPLANTTFEVVFLPRKSAISSDYLLVSTSFGQAQLLVRGEGFECPYRLQPIVGIKAPLNALLEPEIYMYNPHKRPLQIVEVYSSGGQFQLELPSGMASAPQALWEIPPYTTKPIIRIKFHGDSTGNYTAYIRIKIAPYSDDDMTLSQINNEDVLVVPVEFEIYPEKGMYATNPVLDFGRITNAKQKKPLQLYINVRNSDESRDILKVGLADGESLITGLKFEENDLTLTLDTQAFNKTISLDELLILQAKSKDNKTIGPKFTVRVRAEIFKGNLHFNRNTTMFITGDARCKEREQRNWNVRNDFEIPLSFLNVTLSQNNRNLILIQLQADYYDGMTLQPGQSFDLLYLELLNTSKRFHTLLTIVTNITIFEIPIVICTGRLHVTTFNEPLLTPGESFNTELNMGTVPLGEMSQDGYIALYNPNPLPVKITNWNFKSPKGVYFHTSSIGCLRNSALQLFHENQSVVVDGTNFRFCSQLNEGDVSVFVIAIQSYKTELLTSTLQIWTPYETIITTIVSHTWIGKLEVDQEQLYFRNCFPVSCVTLIDSASKLPNKDPIPFNKILTEDDISESTYCIELYYVFQGRLCSAELSIYSTFQHPIHITSINFTNAAIRFENEYSKNLIFALTPNAVTKLGRIYFEPALHCQNRCYLPMDEKQNNLAFPTSSVSENNNFHFDETELRRRTELFRQMKWYFRDISFTVRSRELRQLQLQAFIDIEWPKLFKSGKYKFPNIEAGKVQEQIITIRNPTEQPILVDYYLSDPSYAQTTTLSLPLEVVTISSSCYLTDKLHFSLPHQRDYYKSLSPVLIPPLGSKDITVRFEAPTHERDTFCTLLHIRNNLTLYEAVWLSARVVQSQFRFGNRKPGSATPLLYDLQDKHLSACPEPVLAKRSFTARNTGEVPIWIDTFLIGNQECEGYGFKVFGCGKGFELKTNQSRKIEIVFRPDFTASRVTRLLTIRTNLSYPINYTLQAQLPSTPLLASCTEAVQRPAWEHQSRLAGLFLLLTSFVLVIAAAHVDSESITQAQSLLYIAREKGPVHPTFNLRNIAVKAVTLNGIGGIGASSGNSRQKSNQPQKKRTTTSGAGGSCMRKFSYHPPCIDPFCVSDHNDPLIAKSAEPEAAAAAGAKKVRDLSETNQNVCMNAVLKAENCNKSTAIGENQKSQSPFPSTRADVVNSKKQKTPPLQNTPMNASKKSYTKGKSKGVQQSTPPPAQNAIIELMDKDVALDALVKEESKPSDRSPKSLVEKRNVTQKPIALTSVASSSSSTTIISSTATPKAASNTLPPKTITNASKVVTTAASSPKNVANQQKATAAVSTKTTPTDQKDKTTKSKTPASTIRSSPPITPPSNAIPSNIPINADSSRSVNSTSKSHQSNHNKHGKTPGRERRTKEKHDPSSLSAASSSSSLSSSTNGSHTSKRSDRKETPKMGNNISSSQYNLYENPVKNENVRLTTNTAVKNISSLFDITGAQKVTLNDILEVANKNERVLDVKSKSDNSSPVNPDYQSPVDTLMRNIDFKGEKSTASSRQTPDTISNAEPKSHVHTKAVELGPIGTKKSPSSTPVWESVLANNNNSTVKVCTPLQPKPIDSNSFFSNFIETNDVAPDSGGYDYNNATPSSFMDGVSTNDLYELRKAQAELRRQLNANEYLLSIHQQQLKEQLLRQQKQQQDMLQSMAAPPLPRWQTSQDSTAWRPIGFDRHHAMAMNDSTNKIVMPNRGLENLSRWQSSSMPIRLEAAVRPPPGLGVPPSPSSTTGFSNGLPSRQQLSHNNSHSHFNSTNNNNNNNNSNIQNGQEEERVFDPFSSLSSIWSDNWKQLNRRDDNGNPDGYQQ